MQRCALLEATGAFAGTHQIEDSKTLSDRCGPKDERFADAFLFDHKSLLLLNSWVRLGTLSARWLKKRLQRCMIAQEELAEGVEVLRLNRTQGVGGKDMIEAIPDPVSETPTPPLLLGRSGIAMLSAIDIVQIVGAQLTQNTKLEFMLTGIFE